jgi:large subunit ribosomal protein L17
MLANMVTSLFDKERITTTDAKAKEARRTAERLITKAKKGYQAYQEHRSLKDAGKEAEAKQMQAVALGHWRQASRVVRKRATLKKLFDEIAPQYLERAGGYTRILHLEKRLGDNAQTVLLELVKEDEVVEQPRKSKGKPKGKKAAADKKASTEDEDVAAEDKAAKKDEKAEAAPAEAADDADQAGDDTSGEGDEAKGEEKPES